MSQDPCGKEGTASRVLGRSLLLVVLATVIEGCPYTHSLLSIPYRPSLQPLPPGVAPVVLDRVRDGRTDQRRIGCKKSGTGGEGGSLFLDVPLTQWFRGALLQELQRAGVAAADGPGVPAARLEVRLLDFFVEPEVRPFRFPRLCGLVHAEMKVRLPGGRAYARRFAGHAQESFFFVTDGDYAAVIRAAMQAWIRQAVPGLVGLLRQAGRVPGSEAF